MSARRCKMPENSGRITIFHDGQAIQAHEGEPLAAALMAAGINVLSRSIKYHRPRGASCGSGDCSHCLVTIDGLPNRCACMTPCREGMTSSSQNVLGSAKHDLLGITDWMFPWGLDHHEMFTGVPLVQPVVQKVVHKLSGLGKLSRSHGDLDEDSEKNKSKCLSEKSRNTDVLVVGGGSSGLSAAEAAASARASVILVEVRDYSGGRMTGGIDSAPVNCEKLIEDAKNSGVEIWNNSGAIHVEMNEGSPTVSVLSQDGIITVKPKVLILCCGGYGSTGLFENNDLPGIMAAEWAARLLEKWGILAGEKALICADEPEATALTELFTKAQAPPVRVLPLSAAFACVWPEPVETRILSAKGGTSVEGVIIETENGKENISCDLIMVAAPPAPAYELALLAGAGTSFDIKSGGFAVIADDSGRTEAENVLACGTLTGRSSIREAMESGKKAGRLAASIVAESGLKQETL